jgi:uncharacterized protein YceK
MNKLVGLAVIAVSAVMVSGCAFMTATPSVQGRAYVVKSGTEFWNCDATSGDPVCYQTKKKYAAPAAK